MARKNRALQEHVRAGLKDSNSSSTTAAAAAAGDDSDNDEGAGVWAQNEEEAILGPGDDGTVSHSSSFVYLKYTVVSDCSAP
jgi:hypothetical protein